MSIARTIIEGPSRSISTRPTPSETGRPRHMSAHAIREALLRAEGEYREMPGLCLTLPQAARLWGLDRGTCELVLTNLIARRILKRAANGLYVRG